MTNYEKLKTLSQDQMVDFYINWMTCAKYYVDEDGRKNLLDARNPDKVNKWLSNDSSMSAYMYERIEPRPDYIYIHDT